MKKIFLIALALLLVSCSTSNETKDEDLEKDKEIKVETGAETVSESDQSRVQTGSQSVSESDQSRVQTGTQSVSESDQSRVQTGSQSVEELTKDELILADIAKAEVEYFGLEKYYSRARIFNMLTSKVENSQNISEKVANYAINKANIDFKKNALSTAAIYAYDNWWEKEYIEKTLREEDLFTEQEVKYAMDNLDNVEY